MIYALEVLFYLVLMNEGRDSGEEVCVVTFNNDTRPRDEDK